MPASEPCSTIEGWKSAIQVGGYAITWLIVFVGWRVNRGQNDRRDARKELREHIDAASALVRETENNGVAFLSVASLDVGLFWKTYFSVQRILPAVDELPLANHPEVMNQLVAFRRVMTNKVTIGPTAPFPNESERQLLLRELSRSANKLVIQLEAGYRLRYPLK
jgi:hypothetical protein